DYIPMYNAALVMAEQMKSIGIKVELKVADWPTSVNMMLKPDTGWNFFHSGYGTQPAIGALATITNFVGVVPAYRPPGNKGDPELEALYVDMNEKPQTADRQAAFAAAQKLILERVYALPFGSLTKVQGARANVQGYTPFRIPRVSNVWFTN